MNINPNRPKNIYIKDNETRAYPRTHTYTHTHMYVGIESKKAAHGSHAFRVAASFKPRYNERLFEAYQRAAATNKRLNNP